MGQSINVTGMILMAQPIGESDKRLVLLTRERGKITAFAKGARKQNSVLLAASNPFVFGEFILYEGRNSYNVMGASVLNYFAELTTDYQDACYGFYFLELADYYAREGNDEAQMLKLLYASLRALINNKINNELIRYIYELKVFVINGEYPQVFCCVNCGAKISRGTFSVSRGGLICDECYTIQAHSPSPELDAVQEEDGNSFRNTMILSDSVVYTMQYIISSSLEKLYSFMVTDQVLKELKTVMTQYTRGYIDKKFKSLAVLESMQILRQ